MRNRQADVLNKIAQAKLLLLWSDVGSWPASPVAEAFGLRPRIKPTYACK